MRSHHDRCTCSTRPSTTSPSTCPRTRQRRLTPAEVEQLLVWHMRWLHAKGLAPADVVDHRQDITTPLVVAEDTVVRLPARRGRPQRPRAARRRRRRQRGRRPPRLLQGDRRRRADRHRGLIRTDAAAAGQIIMLSRSTTARPTAAPAGVAASTVTPSACSSAAARPVASTTNASVGIVTVASSGPVGAFDDRRPTVVHLDVDRALDRAGDGDGDGRALRAGGPFAHHDRKRPHESVDRVLGGRAVEVAGTAEGAAQILLVEPTVEDADGEEVGHRAGTGRRGHRPGVVGGIAGRQRAFALARATPPTRRAPRRRRADGAIRPRSR